MKIRHYLLIAFTVIAIAFFQPLILLLGGVTLIIGVTALIYSDLTPEAQDACDNKIVQLLNQARSFLRRNPRRSALQQTINARHTASHRRASKQSLPEQTRPDEIKIDLNIETADQMKNRPQNKAQNTAPNRPNERADKFYEAVNPDL